MATHVTIGSPVRLCGVVEAQLGNMRESKNCQEFQATPERRMAAESKSVIRGQAYLAKMSPKCIQALAMLSTMSDATSAA